MNVETISGHVPGVVWVDEWIDATTAAWPR